METKKPNILFDTLNALFTNKDYINNLTVESIRQNIFMINRRLAINYPLQVQVFNNSKVNAVDELKFWSDFLYNSDRPPKWIYTAGAAKSQAKKESKNNISSSLIKEYCNYYNLSIKDVQSALRFYREEAEKDIFEFEKLRKELKSYEENNQ